jgi:hypothetical protein
MFQRCRAHVYELKFFLQAHPQVTVRTRTRGVPIAGTSRYARFTTITCLVCDLLVYRVYQTYAADVEGKDGPLLPTEDWVERDVLKSLTGWIEVHKHCLVRFSPGPRACFICQWSTRHSVVPLEFDFAQRANSVVLSRLAIPSPRHYYLRIILPYSVLYYRLSPHHLRSRRLKGHHPHIHHPHHHHHRSPDHILPIYGLYFCLHHLRRRTPSSRILQL